MMKAAPSLKRYYTWGCIGLAAFLLFGLAGLFFIVNRQYKESAIVLNGSRHYSHGEYDSAIACWRRALSNRPQDAPEDAMLHLNIGNAYLKKGQLEMAAHEYNVTMSLSHPSRSQPDSFIYTQAERKLIHVRSLKQSQSK